MEGSPQDLGLVGARHDADGDRAGRKGRDPDEALGAKEASDHSQGGAAAEVEEVDRQRVGIPLRTVVYPSATLRARRLPDSFPGSAGPDDGTDQEPAEGDRERIAVACRRARPHPFGPKPMSSK